MLREKVTDRGILFRISKCCHFNLVASLLFNGLPYVWKSLPNRYRMNRRSSSSLDDH